MLLPNSSGTRGIGKNNFQRIRVEIDQPSDPKAGETLNVLGKPGRGSVHPKPALADGYSGRHPGEYLCH